MSRRFVYTIGWLAGSLLAALAMLETTSELVQITFGFAYVFCLFAAIYNMREIGNE